MSEPKALLNKLPQVRRAVRKPSSLRLYHFERSNKVPCRIVRECGKHLPAAAHWEEGALANTQEETGEENAKKVVGSPSQGRNETPQSHAGGEVYGGSPEIIEEDVPIILWGKSQHEFNPGHEQGAYEGTCMIIYPT